jgi:hypothetical protein
MKDEGGRMNQTNDPTQPSSFSLQPFISVVLDDPHPEGSTGMEEAVLALTYDPEVLTVSSSDITLGSIPGLGAGWHLVSVVDQATGQIGIDLYSTTAVAATQAGSLVNIAFHIVPGERVPTTSVQLVNSASPGGHWFSTEVADGEGQFVLSPGVDRLSIQTGLSPGSTAVMLASAGPGQVPFKNLARDVKDTGGMIALFPEDKSSEVMGNGSLTAMPASMLTTGALAFEQDAATVATTQPAGRVFQFGTLPILGALLYRNSPGQLAADRLFAAMGRLMETSVEVSLLDLSETVSGMERF